MYENYLSCLVPNDPQKWRSPQRLTVLQRKIIFYLSEGYSQEQAAKECHISDRKLRYEIEDMKLQMGCVTTIQLVVKVHEDKAA